MSDDIMGQPAAVAPQPKGYDRAKDDAKIESQFLTDYLVFGLQINWNCIRVLLEKARVATDGSILQKSLCVSGLQVMYSSWEDFVGCRQLASPRFLKPQKWINSARYTEPCTVSKQT